MTKEQVLFYVGKQRLKQLEEVEKERSLTSSEEAERDKIKTILFESIARFGISQAHTRMNKYRKDRDALKDVQQEMALIFFEKLPLYDPTRSTPTTFFLRYFNQAISEYVLKNSQHMTQYDAHNVSVVRAAIKHFESQGIKWDMPMLVTRTKLSPKVVSNTLQIAANSIRANVDDVIDLASSTLTPEEALIQSERTATLYNALKETLSVDELEFFLYKLNIDGKERSYQQVADDLGLQVRDVKRQWNGIVARLNASSSLHAYNHSKNDGREAKVCLHEQVTPSPDQEELLFAALGGMKFPGAPTD